MADAPDDIVNLDPNETPMLLVLASEVGTSTVGLDSGVEFDAVVVKATVVPGHDTTRNPIEVFLIIGKESAESIGAGLLTKAAITRSIAEQIPDPDTQETNA